jgi:hypothetical protein
MRRWVKDMSSAMDEDLGDDFEQALEDDLQGTGDEGAESGPRTDETVY